MIVSIDDWEVTYHKSSIIAKKKDLTLSLRRMVLIAASSAVLLFVLSSIFSSYFLFPAVGISIVLLAALSMVNVEQWVR